MVRRLQSVVAPLGDRQFETGNPPVDPTHPHELVTDVANNPILPRLDRVPSLAHPEIAHDLPPRADLKPAFAVALEKHREDVKVCMGTRTPEVGTKLLALGRMVMQQPKDRLGVSLARIDGARRECVLREPETVGKALHDFDGEPRAPISERQGVIANSLLHLPHELLCPAPEPLNVLILRPKPLHPGKLQLHRLLLVRRARTRPDLGVLFPTRVLAVQRGLGLDLVWQGEEPAGEIEGGLDVIEGNAVVGERAGIVSMTPVPTAEAGISRDLQEADVCRRFHEFLNDLLTAIVKVMQGDGRHTGHDRFADEGDIAVGLVCLMRLSWNYTSHCDHVYILELQKHRYGSFQF
jgi:hypothetical protein